MAEIDPDKTDEDGTLEIAIRLLGNEIIGLRIYVDDFRAKWAVMSAVVVMFSVAAISMVAEYVLPLIQYLS